MVKISFNIVIAGRDIESRNFRQLIDLRIIQRQFSLVGELYQIMNR